MRRDWRGRAPHSAVRSRSAPRATMRDRTGDSAALLLPGPLQQTGTCPSAAGSRSRLSCTAAEPSEDWARQAAAACCSVVRCQTRQVQCWASIRPEDGHNSNSSRPRDWNSMARSARTTPSRRTWGAFLKARAILTPRSVGTRAPSSTVSTTCARICCFLSSTAVCGHPRFMLRGPWPTTSTWAWESSSDQAAGRKQSAVGSRQSAEDKTGDDQVKGQKAKVEHLHAYNRTRRKETRVCSLLIPYCWAYCS